MKDLSQYRRKPIESRITDSQVPGSEAEDYVAFNAKDYVPRLQIRTADVVTYSMPYLLLGPFIFDRDYGTTFTLNFGEITMQIIGQNLQPMIAAIHMGTAEFIQEFDGERWSKPSDSKTPIIESIKVEAHGPAALAAQDALSRKGRTH